MLVGDSELARGKGERGTKDTESEAVKFISETERETGRTAMDGLG